MERDMGLPRRDDGCHGRVGDEWNSWDSWNRLRENGNVYIPPRPFLLGLFAVIFSRLFFLRTKTKTAYQDIIHTIPTSIPDQTTTNTKL